MKVVIAILVGLFLVVLIIGVAYHPSEPDKQPPTLEQTYDDKSSDPERVVAKLR